MPFILRSVIRGHESDIRAVYPALHPEGGVLTASRDQTCRLWVPGDEFGNFTEGHIFSGHTRYISAVTTLPPSEKHPHGLVATGGHDCKILIFSFDSLEPIYTLEGHAGAISSIVSGKFGTLLSGSWDKTAKVWVNGQCVMTLKEHTAAIWAVEMMPDQGYMITGSADKNIKLWKGGNVERTLTGHTDCVRGLVTISSFEFLSCSNDCIASLPSGNEDFATCGEDRSLRIWKDGSCVQTITMPCTSVWSVCCLANGDIVVGSSDGVARIFTSDESRIAPPDVLKAFEEEVANQAIPAASNLDLGEIDKDELPGPESLLTPGVKDGQTKLIKQGSKVAAHQWDAAQQQWKKIGDVVGAAGQDGTARTSNKKVYNGKEYDYVFDVDIAEGKPPLKLPFNITDDPWMAAHKFLGENDLSPSFLEEVVQFILKNTKNVRIGQTEPQFSDPFTGGSRYIPGSRVQSSDPQINAFQDPFTGGNRYVPGGQASNPPRNPANMQDPFTGASRYTPTNGKKAEYLSFDQAKPLPIVTKLREFNSQVDESVMLTEDELAALADSLEIVCNHKDINEEQCQLLLEVIDKLLKWPVKLMFPGLDSVRLLIMLKFINEKLLSHEVASNFIDTVRQAASYCVALRSSPSFEDKVPLLHGISEVLQLELDGESQFRLLVAMGTLIFEDTESLSFASSIGLKSILEKLQSVKDPSKVGDCASQLLNII
eukprot:gene10393-19090_t